MGLGVLLYAEMDTITDDALYEAEKFFVARSDLGDTNGSGNVLEFDTAEWYPRPRVVVYTLDRFYGQHYERGNWPRIFGGIVTLQAAFPDAPVYYGSDSNDVGILCTNEYLGEIWQHFLGDHGVDYRKRAAAWNAGYRSNATTKEGEDGD